MTKITIEFQGENSTEFKVDASGATYRELLVLARELRESGVMESLLEDTPVIEIESGELIKTSKCVQHWHLQLVADEFYLAAQHQFFTIQNQAMAQAAQEAQANQIAIAKLQRGGRGNSGLVFPGGQG